MYRNLTISLAAILIVLLIFTSMALSQSAAWPEYPNLTGRAHSIDRGPGGYLSWIKLLFSWGLILGWVATTDWVNRDCQKLNLPYAIWNSIVFFPFFIAVFAIMLTVPIFLAGWPITALCWLVPVGIYVVKRNSVVEPTDRVLTPDHIRFLLSQQAKSIGMSVSAEKKAAYELGAPLTFTGRGGTDEQNQSNMIWSRQSPGFLPAKALIAKSVDSRALKIMLDYAQGAATVRFQIDGVWIDDQLEDQEHTEAMLTVFKKLANLDIKQRRARQEGRFLAEYEGAQREYGIVCQATKTGEKVFIQVINTEVPFKKLEDLGMREKMRQQVKELLARENGMLVFSSLPSGGLSTALTVALRESDRYMREYAAVLEAKATEPEVENVVENRYDAAAGQTPATILPSLIRKQPDVLVVHDLPNAETVQLLCEVANDDRLVFVTIRAKEAAEALLRILMLKVPANEFATAVSAVLNQRLVRRLCDECKEAYTPSPDLLKKLGIPAGRIESFYRPPENVEEVCEKCNGVGYYERTSIFELLIVNDKVRGALTSQPKLDVIRKIARQSGNRNLQDEGIALVARGVTSLAELNRVLKQ